MKQALIHLHGMFTSTDMPLGRDADKLDCTIMILSPRTVWKLTQAQYITEDIISRSIQQFYMLYGYPRSRVKILAKTIRSQALGHGTNYISDLALYLKLGLRPETHILARYEEKCADREGNVDNAPDPTGCSGGPLFAMGQLGTLDTYNPTWASLAGLSIEYRNRDNVIVAVRFDYLIHHIKLWIQCYFRGWPSGTP